MGAVIIVSIRLKLDHVHEHRYFVCNALSALTPPVCFSFGAAATMDSGSGKSTSLLGHFVLYKSPRLSNAVYLGARARYSY